MNDSITIAGIYNIPYTNINAIPSIASTPTSTSSGCLTGDETSESFIPTQLVLKPEASLDDLSNTIMKCKELVLNCDQCSEERKWLVRYLVELRFRVEELKDAGNNPSKLGITIAGHHFKSHTSLNANVKQYCDHCSGVIWSVVQGSYICEDCNFICHSKCVSRVLRVCAHVIATEGVLETSICSHKGLAAQHYKCAECKTDLKFIGRASEPRLCDYSGLFFCSTCHWNNTVEIPARVVHNWDWEKRPVSQAAYQLLTLTRKRPLINLEEANNKLFAFVAELGFVRKMRGDLRHMRRYLVACQTGSSLINGDMLHMAETSNLYSVENLELARDGELETQLCKFAEKCRAHIMDCKVCYGKGYLCELCGNDDVIFPFDSGAVGCDKCNSFFHRVCWTRKNKNCPKCIRIQKRFDAIKSNPDIELNINAEDDFLPQ